MGVNPQKSKVFYLDGIRGLAALCVVAHHFLLGFYPAYYNGDLSASHTNGFEVAYGRSVFSFLSNGHFCVCIFFVLSGLVLSKSYFDNPRIETLQSAALRRFLRLYIPVAATLTLAYVLTKIGLFYNQPASQIAHSEWWMGYMWAFEHKTILYVKSMLYTVMFMGDNMYDTSLWTLSLELYGSLLVFAFLALTHNLKAKGFLLAALLAVFVITGFDYYAAFMLGIALNHVPELKAKLPVPFVFIVSTVLFIAGLVLGSYPMNNDLKGTIFARLPDYIIAQNKWAHITAGFFVVLAVVLSKNLQWFFSLRPMRFLGYISFSIYLIHPLIIGSFSSFVLVKLVPRFSYNTAMSIVTLSTLVVSFYLSYLMAKYVDAKGMELSRRFYEKYLKNT